MPSPRGFEGVAAARGGESHVRARAHLERRGSRTRFGRAGSLDVRVRRGGVGRLLSSRRARFYSSVPSSSRPRISDDAPPRWGGLVRARGGDGASGRRAKGYRGADARLSGARAGDGRRGRGRSRSRRRHRPPRGVRAWRSDRRGSTRGRGRVPGRARRRERVVPAPPCLPSRFTPRRRRPPRGWRVPLRPARPRRTNSRRRPLRATPLAPKTPPRDPLESHFAQTAVHVPLDARDGHLERASSSPFRLATCTVGAAAPTTSWATALATTWFARVDWTIWRSPPSPEAIPRRTPAAEWWPSPPPSFTASPPPRTVLCSRGATAGADDWAWTTRERTAATERRRDPPGFRISDRARVASSSPSPRENTTPSRCATTARCSRGGETTTDDWGTPPRRRRSRPERRFIRRNRLSRRDTPSRRNTRREK